MLCLRRDLAVRAAALLPNLYRDQIEPLLGKSCVPCHNSKVKQGGLDLSTRESLLKGSEHGPVVISGNPNDSQLYKVVAHISEPAMPFKGKKLPDDDVAKISAWIKAGVPFGEGADPDSISRAEAEKHWAFKSPVRPPVPVTTRASKNPIDAFITRGQEKRGLAPLPEADKRTLLRRVYYDLVGIRTFGTCSNSISGGQERASLRQGCRSTVSE